MVSDLESELRGTSLRVYWLLISQTEPIGVRDVQRALKMSSPSVASHHLNKLVSIDLLEKNRDGNYVLKKFVKVGILRNYIEYRGKLLPRYLFVAMFFTTCAVFYLISTLFISSSVFDRYIAIIIIFLASAFAWAETYTFWRIKIS